MATSNLNVAGTQRAAGRRRSGQPQGSPGCPRCTTRSACARCTAAASTILTSAATTLRALPAWRMRLPTAMPTPYCRSDPCTLTSWVMDCISGTMLYTCGSFSNSVQWSGNCWSALQDMSMAPFDCGKAKCKLRTSAYAVCLRLHLDHVIIHSMIQ